MIQVVQSGLEGRGVKRFFRPWRFIYWVFSLASIPVLGLASGYADSFLIPAQQPLLAGDLILEAPSGTLPCIITQPTTSKNLHVLMVLDGLPLHQWEETKQWLYRLQTVSGSQGAFSLSIAMGGEVKQWRPFRSLGRLRSEIEKLTPVTRPEGIQDWKTISDITSLLPLGISSWEALLIIAPVSRFHHDELKAYAECYLSYLIRKKSLRLYYKPILLSSYSTAPPRIQQTAPSHLEDRENSLDFDWRRLTSTTGGAVLHDNDSPERLLECIGENSSLEVNFAGPVLAQGIFPFTAQLIDKSTHKAIAEVSSLLLPPGREPLSLDQYARALTLLADARVKLTERRPDQVRQCLEAGLKINPLHPGTLRFAARMYQQQGDDQTALRLLAPLMSLTVNDASLFSDIGEIQYEMKHWEESEKNYRRSLEILPGQQQVLERLSEIYEAKGDLPGALKVWNSFLEPSPNNVKYLVRQGNLLEKNGCALDAAESYEKALRQEPLQEELRIHLIGLYSSIQKPEKVKDALLEVGKLKSFSPASRVRYAELAEKLNQIPEALALYCLALESEPGYEPALYGRSRLLMETGQVDEARSAMQSALKASSDSIRLHELNIELLSRLEEPLEKRAAVEAALAVSGKKKSVLTLAARVRDEFGDRAAKTYEELANLLEKNSSEKNQLVRILQRGVLTGLRDGDRETASRLAERLRSIGATTIPELNSVLPSRQGPSGLLIPGGIRALAFAAHLNADTQAQVFAAQYAGALVRNIQRKGNKDGELLFNELRLYFQTLSSLRLLAGPVDQGKIRITLSTGNKNETELTEKVLQLLGWRIRRLHGKTKLEVSVKESEAQRQSFVSALGIDEIEMKSRLESSQSFSIEITDERVPMAFDEKFWFEKILEKPRPLGGLTEFMLENPAVASLYAGLASMNTEAQRQLVLAVQPRKLLYRCSDLVYAYGAALAVENDQISVPGGLSSLPIWHAFAGVSPRNPPEFLATLLIRDEGKMLAFFHAISLLPAANQRFFTYSPARLLAFYKAFPFAEKESLTQHAFVRRSTYFNNLAREIPLNEDQSISFPGSANVWMVARGTSENIEQIGRLLKKAARVTLPEVEDNILLRMLDTKYEVEGFKFEQVENFLAVVRLDQHRTEPMDEQLAILLSQNYAKFRDVYPYFASFPRLSSEDFTLFLQAARSIENLDRNDLNTALGEFHGLIHLLVLLRENGRVSEDETERLFGFICEGFAKAVDSRDFATHSLNSLQKILATLGHSQPHSADDRLLDALTGPEHPVQFTYRDRDYRINRSASRKREIRSILNQQIITPLEVLLTLFNNAQVIVKGTEDPAAKLRSIEQEVKGLRDAPLVEQRKVPQPLRNSMFVTSPEEIAKLILKMKKELAKKKSKELAKLAGELIGQLNPYIKTSLVGWIYAYYFLPDDLALAEDSLLVLRHEFYDRHSGSKGKKNCWGRTYHRQYSDQSGTYVEGGLAQIAAVAGKLGLMKREASESADRDSSNSAVAAAQLAAWRTVPWPKVDVRGAHLMSLTIRLGRELLVEAAVRPDLRHELAEHSLGLLGPIRRLDLLDAITKLDLGVAQSLLSSADLYQLASSYWKYHGRKDLPESIVATALEQELKHTPIRQAEIFGGYHPQSYGCVHSHYVPLGPYEDFENHRFPDMMSERLSHLPMTIVELVDRLGIPVETLGLLGEAAVLQAARNSKMNAPDDWPAALQSMDALQLDALLPTLEKKMIE